MEVGLAVGGAFLSSALNVFFDRMTPKYLDLFRGHNGANHLLRKLKRTLRDIEAMLDYAEEKQTIKRHVREWLAELKDTVHHAEDLVDEINIEALRLNVVEGAEQNAATNTMQDANSSVASHWPAKGGQYKHGRPTSLGLTRLIRLQRMTESLIWNETCLSVISCYFMLVSGRRKNLSRRPTNFSNCQWINVLRSRIPVPRFEHLAFLVHQYRPGTKKNYDNLTEDIYDAMWPAI